jgi:hypothetical protein
MRESSKKKILRATILEVVADLETYKTRAERICRESGVDAAILVDAVELGVLRSSVKHAAVRLRALVDTMLTVRPSG